MEIRKGRYFVGAWYLNDSANPSLQNQDWFASIYRDEGETRWHLAYRHKYYNSPDPFDKNDRRSTFHGTHDGLTERQVIEIMEKAVGQVAEAGQFKHRDFIYFGTDDPESILERMKGRDYMHMKIQEVERPQPSGSTDATPPGA